MNRFDGKVVIITGATSGIGKQAALDFAVEGARVVLAGRRQSEGDALADEIAQRGGKALFIQADVSQAEQMKYLVDKTMSHFKRLDGAFNNAGIGGPQGALTDLDETNWDQVMNINLKGVWLSMKYQIPAMLKTGGGNIVNMASLWGVGGSNMGLAAYIASKHGVIGLTKAAALEYASQGIRVNSICPAWVPTEANAHVLSDPTLNAQIAAMHPVGRLGTVEEISEAVLWLCSDKTGFITGHSLLADGGIAARL